MQRYKMDQITPLKRLQNIIESAGREKFEANINEAIRQNAIERADSESLMRKDAEQEIKGLSIEEQIEKLKAEKTTL